MIGRGMADWTEVASTAAIYAAGVVIPGPNFFAVSHRAMAEGRRAALLMAAGIVSVNLLWATCAIVGVGIALNSYPSLGIVLKVFGSAYLLWFAYRIAIRNPSTKTTEKQSTLKRKPYLSGMLINLSNPESMMYYASVFSSSIAIRPSLPTLFAMLAVIGLIGYLWYGGMSLVLSTEAVAARYRLAGRLVDICASLCIIGLCIRNLF